MVYDLDMELRDLPPRKDPKGGSPKTPKPIPVSEFHRPEMSQQEKHHFSPVFKNGGYAMSTLGRYAVSFLLGALSAAFLVGSKSQNITDLIQWKGTMSSLSNEWKGHTDATLERMDTFGTNASKFSIGELNSKIAANKVLIEELQKKVEPIGAMQVKIENLQREVATKK